MSKAPPLRVTLVTLGVDDLPRAIKFYEALGLPRRMKQSEQVAFFDAGGVVLSLFGRGALAEDAKVENSKPGFSGIALAYNVATEAEVDLVIDAAQAAGGRILKKAERVFWGGYSGYFADPEGHLWEVAHNPQVSFDDHGTMLMPD